MKICSFILSLLLSFSLWAGVFEKGKGSEFVMESQGQKVDLSIYITEVEEKKMGVEFHFGAGGVFITNMWQQFHFSLNGFNPISITGGYIQTAPGKNPEVMTSEVFTMNKGVQIQDFLFNTQEGALKGFIGDELVELPAGTIMAKHFRKERDGQTIDFWIADEVKPIGLVKLVSKSKVKATNNYQIELKSLLRGVKPTIDPKKAIPLSKSTAEMLKLKK